MSMQGMKSHASRATMKSYVEMKIQTRIYSNALLWLCEKTKTQV